MDRHSDRQVFRHMNQKYACSDTQMIRHMDRCSIQTDVLTDGQKFRQMFQQIGIVTHKKFQQKMFIQMFGWTEI